MTLAEARKILGLKPDEDPRPHLDALQKAREQIAEMVRTAPTETIALRNQDQLMEFDQALAALREHQVAPVDPAPQEIAKPSKVEKVSETPDLEEKPKARSSLLPVAILFLVLIAAAVGGLFYLKQIEEQERLLRAKIARLNEEGIHHIENRNWPEATALFDEIEKLAPESELVPIGRRSIEAGMIDAQNQFVGYWNGQATAFFEAERWDDAESAAQQVLNAYPNDPDATDLMTKIAEARQAEAKRVVLDAARTDLEQRRWDEAIEAVQQILTTDPEDEVAKQLLKDANAAKETARINTAKARVLFERAKEKDHGAYDQEILDLMRQAAVLAPDDAEIASFLERMASYTRTLRVPSDFATPVEALAEARDRDRVVIAEGTWAGPIVVNAAVILEGSGFEKTIVECAGDAGTAITLGPGADGARISGFTFRHNTIEVGEERFSAALLRGGTAEFVDCHFQDASGHGLLVVEGGHAVANRCKFSANGWNGVAVSAEGSLLEVSDSESSGNYGHGIESWDGASVILSRNRCETNSRNGIHASIDVGSVSLVENQLSGNREFGLVLDSAGSGRVVANIVKGNLLGGIVVREAAAGVRVAGNQAIGNLGPGIILEHGLGQAPYGTNISDQNQGGEILSNANLSADEAAKPASTVEPDSEGADPR